MKVHDCVQTQKLISDFLFPVFVQKETKPEFYVAISDLKKQTFIASLLHLQMQMTHESGTHSSGGGNNKNNNSSSFTAEIVIGYSTAWLSSQKISLFSKVQVT